jgi:hypothetical protein
MVILSYQVIIWSKITDTVSKTLPENYPARAIPHAAMQNSFD